MVPEVIVVTGLLLTRTDLLDSRLVLFLFESVWPIQVRYWTPLWYFEVRRSLRLYRDSCTSAQEQLILELMIRLAG